MFRQLAAPLALSAMLSACGVGEVTEDNYAEKYARYFCSYQRECAQSYFYGSYSDVSDCEDEVLDLWADNEEYLDTCEFDAQAATKCLESLSRSCKEIGSNMEEAWEDCNEVYFECEADSTM
jgi:hypothetical protein